MSKILSYITLIAIFYILKIDAKDKLKLNVYYESLCPDSRAFIINQLVPTYSQLSSKFSVELVPYGHANFTKVDTTEGMFDVNTVCQHGVEECLGNRIHSCVLPNESIDRSLEYFNCIFNSINWTQPAAAGEQCANTLNFNWTSIRECAYGPLGRGLLLENANKHYQLNPKENWVPWLTLNGEHTDDIQQKGEKDLLNFINEQYGENSSIGYSFVTINITFGIFSIIHLFIA